MPQSTSPTTHPTVTIGGQTFGLGTPATSSTRTGSEMPDGGTLPHNITIGGQKIALGPATTLAPSQPTIPPGKAKLAAVNASLNGASTLLLIAGLVMIKRRKPIAHQYLMISALVMSAVFLTCYLSSYFLFGEVSSKSMTAAPNWARTLYLIVLLPHLLAAVGMLPMIAKALFHAWKGQFDKHRKIAKPTWFIWFYVSTTGVLVYWMLYHWLPSFGAS